MKVDTYTCDWCGATKGSTNHWFIATTDVTGLRIAVWPLVHLEAEKQLCGQACAQKLLEQWMSGK